MHHLIIKGADTCGYVTTYDKATMGVCGVLLNSMFCGGVNLFILITGWFGIKKCCLSALHIFMSVAIFGILVFLFSWIGNTNCSISHILAFVDFRNWFIVSYLMLVLVAPIIEKSLQNVNMKELTAWLILLTIFNVFCGYFLGQVNVNGYNVINFIYLYYVARWLRMLQENKKSKFLIYAKYGFGCWLFLSFLLGMGFLFLSTQNISINSVKYWAYNNPLVIGLSVSFFVMVTSWKIKRRYINWFASGMFGVFLLHSNSQILTMRNEYAAALFTDYSYFGLFLFGFCILFLGGILSAPIEKYIRFISMHVVSKKKKNENLSGR